MTKEPDEPFVLTDAEGVPHALLDTRRLGDAATRLSHALANSRGDQQLVGDAFTAALEEFDEASRFYIVAAAAQMLAVEYVGPMLQAAEVLGLTQLTAAIKAPITPNQGETR